MFAVTAILSCIIKICGLFKSTKWRHSENVRFEALSTQHVIKPLKLKLVDGSEKEVLSKTYMRRKLNAFVEGNT